MTVGHLDAVPARRAGAPDEQLRLMTKIARMYHERGMRQSEIADELDVSQPRVSRLLKRAEEAGIVRTTVTLPAGVHTDLEKALEQRYDLKEAIVVDAGGSAEDVTRALRAATAVYLETTLTVETQSASRRGRRRYLRLSSRCGLRMAQVVDTVVQVVGDRWPCTALPSSQRTSASKGSARIGTSRSDPEIGYPIESGLPGKEERPMTGPTISSRAAGYTVRTERHSGCGPGLRLVHTAPMSLGRRLAVPSGEPVAAPT